MRLWWCSSVETEGWGGWGQAEGPKGEAVVELDMVASGATFGTTLGESPACHVAASDTLDSINAGCLVRGPPACLP